MGLANVGKVVLAVAMGVCVGFVLLLALPGSAAIHELVGIPAVCGLGGALLQIIRDGAAHERALSLFALEKLHFVAASSHMADVAFDRHVEFSEAYLAEVHATLATLGVEGPTAKALGHANSLYHLRQRFAVWLTPQIDDDLMRFESALRKVGASAGAVAAYAGAPNQAGWISEMYKTFADILGVENFGADQWEGQELTQELAVATVVRGLRKVLGAEELAALRVAVVAKAVDELRRTDKSVAKVR